MNPLISRKELAKRWAVSPATIDRMAYDGIITKCQYGKYKLVDIEEYERSGSNSKSAPETFTERRLKIENENLRAENQQLKQTMYKIVELLGKFLQEDVQKIMRRD